MNSYSSPSWSLRNPTPRSILHQRLGSNKFNGAATAPLTEPTTPAQATARRTTDQGLAIGGLGGNATRIGNTALGEVDAREAQSVTT